MTLLATLDHADADLTACLARVMAAILKPGDTVLCRLDEAGRHFGMRIREDIREI